MEETEQNPAESTDAEQPSLERARFGDRFVAFSVDLLILSIGYLLLLIVLARIFAGIGMTPAQLNILWFGVFVAVFVLYHGFMNADGRASFGKRLVGIQVYTQEGYPPSLGISFLRAFGYLLSNLFFALGYLWALLHPQKLTWHDLLAGTMVMETKPKSPMKRTVLALAAWGLAFFYVASAGWSVGAPQYERMQLIANAKRGVAALAAFEEIHKEKTGRYTGDLTALGQEFGDTEEFFELLSQTMDLGSLEIKASKDAYSIRTLALDGETQLDFQGPVE